MKFKKGWIFICLLICLFSIASVVAADVNETVVANDNQNNELIEINDENDNILAVEDQDIYQTITSDVLTQSEDENLISDSENDNKIIDGNGTTTSTRMTISGNNVTLMNYNFVGAYVHADYTPGALLWSGNNGKIINCTFVSNSGSPGALKITGSNCTVINCTFDNNQLNAIQYGGAVVWSGANGTIINSIFTETQSNNEGGAIYWSGKNAKIINCTFSKNHAWRGGAIQFGGSSTAQIINSTFINNHDSQGGGAIYTWSGQNIIIDGCSFIENSGSSIINAIGVKLINNSYFYKNTGGIGADNISTSLFYQNTGHVSASNIINSIFLNNTVKQGDDTQYISTSTNLEFNWFGNTVEDYLICPNSGGNLKNWLFVNATHEKIMLVGKQMSIPFVFQVYDGTTVFDYDSSKVYPVNLNLSATNGEINKLFSVVGEEILYNASAVGNGTITAKFFDKTLTIDLICKKPTEIITNDSITIYVDQFMNFTGDEFSAILIPSQAGSLVYSTDDENILNVTSNGFAGFNGGFANLIVEFIETDEYAPFKVLVPITVLKYDAEISVTDSITMDYNDFKTIEATLTPNVGNFVYSSDNINIATVNNNGLISAVGAGTTNITVIFEGNRKYYATNKTIFLTVNKIDSNISLSNEIIYSYDNSNYTTATVVGATGVTAFVLDHPEANVKVNNYKITVSSLDVGNYTLVVTTIPDNNHLAVNTTTNITVIKSDSSITIPTITFDYGGSKTVTATIRGAINITDVKVENHPEALIYVSGKSITVSELDAGTYTLIATTVPDKNHNAVNGTAKITVNKVNSLIEFSNELVFDYGSSDYTSVTITYATNITNVKVSGHSEAVINIEDNIITVSGLNAGTYTLSATTVPDNNHKPVTGTTTITVNKINSSLSIENDIVFDYGESNYTYAIFDGATSVKASVAGYSATINIVGGKITVSGLNAGNYTLHVYTVPDNNHISVSADAKITVNKVDPIVTISPVIFDYEDVGSTRVLTTANINFDANVIGHPEAIISISGKKISISNLETGNYTLEVNTHSNNNYNPITLTTNITVNKIDSIILADDIIFDYGYYGSTEVYLEGATKFNASVINHTEANVVIVGNEILVSNLDAGDYYLNITSIPDENHNSITVTPLITVEKVDASIIIPTIVFDYDDSTTVSPVLEGVAKITYAFVLNHNEALVEISDNNEITVSGLNAGKYKLVVTTEPDTNHNPISSVTADIIVNKINSAVFVPEINFNYGLYGSAKVILNGATKFKANINGDATHLSINDDVIVIFGLDAGTYDLNVTTIPDTNHNAVTSVSKIIVNKLSTILTSSDITKVYGTSKNLIVKLNDVNGKLLVNEIVKVTLNNVVYSARVNSNGQAVISVPYNLAVKSYSATITFAGNANYAKSTATAKVIVKKATPKLTAKTKSFKKAKKIKKYSITLKSGKTPIKKAKVTIKIKKKTYTAKTNAKGKATFKIKKLTKKGTYKATVTYKGNAYYNKVTKTVKIKIK